MKKQNRKVHLTTSNLFLKYFSENDEKNCIYICIASLEISGPPLDENENELDNDCLVYIYCSDSKTYQPVTL